MHPMTTLVHRLYGMAPVVRKDDQARVARG
jgi:hypothetical protein